LGWGASVSMKAVRALIVGEIGIFFSEIRVDIEKG
jgi:hypothetical protein